MIGVQEATDIILAAKIKPDIAEIDLKNAIDKVLAEDLSADRDFPPYHRITMDGIAIDYASFKAGQRSFPVAELVAAGQEQSILENSANCLEVMTGAVLPKNTDTVVRYEDLSLENGVATIQTEQLRQGQNIHRKGDDRRTGEVIVKAGVLIASPEISIAASIGKTHLKIYQLPKVLIISTGDEVIEVSETPLAHQIRKSNIYHIQSELRHWGIETDTMHLPDRAEAVRNELEQALGKYRVIIMTGGVSKGKRDYIPDALASFRVEKLFHTVRQRPGRPFWFGKAKNKTLVFAFPGNPVASFLCLYRYFLPWLKASLQLPTTNYRMAVLSDEVTFMPDLTYFLEVKIAYTRRGVLYARPSAGCGSGDLANLVNTDGFIELPETKNKYKKGEVYPFIAYRR